jgi:hypothetical protein
MKLTRMPESLSPWRWSLLLLASAPLLACGYGHGHMQDDGYYYDDGSSTAVFCGDVEESLIDTDEALEVDPGVGAGAFVEYESGGTYRVTTSCDANQGGACFWDILVTPLDDAPVLGLSPFDLEGDDSVSIADGNTVRMVATTGTDFDGFTLQTDAGVGIRFDGLLDEACSNRYLFWVGDGALHSGAPSNPIDLVPSAE